MQEYFRLLNKYRIILSILEETGIRDNFVKILCNSVTHVIP